MALAPFAAFDPGGGPTYAWGRTPLPHRVVPPGAPVDTATRELACLPPPPRQVRRRRGHLQMVGHFVMIVAALMFAYLFWTIALGQVRLQFFGTIVPARVEKIWSVPGPRGPTLWISVAYHYEDKAYAQRQLCVGNSEAKKMKVGDTLPVEVLPGWPTQAVQYHENHPFWFVTIFSCAIALLPTAAAAKALWDLYVAPWRRRDLLCRGEATTGVIVDKKESEGRQPTYSLTYQFRPAAQPWQDSADVRAKMCVGPEEFLGCQTGDRVVVVYSPERPRRSVIYRFADFEFV
jgi:hypothetical protein